MLITSTTAQIPLRDARRKSGLSLRAAATQAGIDPGHLSKVERGQKGLSIPALHRLAAVLDLQDLVQSLAPYAGAPERAA
ncbi:helix-turn-helix transcriptional regulator [Streptomyces sp. NPDC085995]|uniref:helix-turn-helix domain-containing protein n=1 Tax=Streptomyces sp. NPDC085995 TaxID=3154861 RepID=UPI00342DC666